MAPWERSTHRNARWCIDFPSGAAAAVGALVVLAGDGRHVGFRTASAEDCRCIRTRCIDKFGREFVFAPQTEMPSPDALYCIRNNSAYEVNGECRYCERNCANNVCDCISHQECNPIALIAVVFTLVTSSCCIAFGCYQCLRHRHVQVQPYEKWVHLDSKMENWQKNRWLSVIAPCSLGAALVVVGMMVWWWRETTFDDAPPEEAPQKDGAKPFGFKLL